MSKYKCKWEKRDYLLSKHIFIYKRFCGLWIQKDFVNSFDEAEKLIANWENPKPDPQTTYYKVKNGKIVT